MIKIKQLISVIIKKIVIMFLVLSMLTIRVPNNTNVIVNAINDDSISLMSLIPENSNPNFTIQHYYYVDKVKTTDSAPSGNYISFINTSDGKPGEVPENKNTKNNVLEGITSYSKPKLTYVSLVPNSDLSDSRMELSMQRELVELFEDEKTDYITNPQIQFMNRLYNSTTDYNSNYTLKEIWVYQPDDNGSVKNIDTLEPTDFIKYPVPLSAYGTRHEPEKMRFTNNPNNSHISDVVNKVPVADIATEIYPYYYTILIQQNTVIRLVFDTTIGEKIENVNFFDYDISDGNIYPQANISSPNPTSSQTTSSTWYANVYNSGINNTFNYSGVGSKYAFGNSNKNVPTGKGDEKWTFNNNQIYINRYSSYYEGIAFGLLKSFSMNSNNKPIPIWSNNIDAPAIFDDTKDVSGKTDYTKEKGNGYKLGFYRNGTNYTLNKVIDSKNNTVLNDLRGIMITYQKNSTILYSNEFWPLDTSASYGTDGHDFKFGDSTYGPNRYFFSPVPVTGHDGVPKQAPSSDKSADHNSYFGMTYSVDFTVYPGYNSPLNYWFYGDDDMWAFLSKVDDDGNIIVGSEKKIVDIGGVHSSAGVYSNLWEYIDYNPLFNADGTENTKSDNYRLTFFYTERGASGSSCFMKFTIPLDISVSTALERGEAIMVEKAYVDIDEKEIAYDPNGEQYHFLLTMTNENGISYEDVYDYAIYRKDITPDHTAASATPIEKGVIGLVNPLSGKYEFSLRSGEYIIISNLPENTHYTVEETSSGDYYTYYQTGTHQHQNNKQVDTLNSEKIIFDVENTKRYDAAKLNYIKFINEALDYKNFEFKKVDVQNLTPLENAKFNIYEYTCTDMNDTSLIDINNVSTCWSLHDTAVSNTDGTIVLKKVYKNKRYRLVEVEAPEGYSLPDGQWNIDVSKELNFSITAVGEKLPLAFINDSGKLLLPNVRNLDIPETGSISGIMYTIFGTISIGMSVILYIILNRKKRYN